MSSILVTADLHLSDNPRDAYRFEALKTIKRIAGEARASEIYILGDLTEEKDRHSAWLTNAVVTALEDLREVADLVILQGNHDSIDPTCPFFGFLDRLDCITWISEPKHLGRWLFLPHTRDYAKDWKDVFDEEPKLIFAHNTFQGADNGLGHKLDGIPLDAFPKGSRVISGDVHVPQDIRKIVTYVGAPYTVDFGDNYEPRVLLLEEGRFLETISILVPGVQKRLFEIKNIEELDDPCIDAAPGDILKVRMPWKAGSGNWSDTRNAIIKWGETNGYVINSIQPVLEQSSGKRKLKLSARARTDEQLLKEYARRNNIDDKTLGVGIELCE